MRYWPMSVIRTSPLMPGTYAPELAVMEQTLKLSSGAFDACGMVAEQTPVVDVGGLVVIENADLSPPRFAYLKRPTPEQFQRMERASVVSGPGIIGVMIDAMH